MTHLTAMWMDESNPVRANHHPQMIGSLQKIPWAPPFFPNRSCWDLPKAFRTFPTVVLSFQSCTTKGISSESSSSGVSITSIFSNVHRVFAVVVSNVPHTSGFIIINFWGDDRWDHYTIHPCNMTCVKNCAEYMVSILVLWLSIAQTYYL